MQFAQKYNQRPHHQDSLFQEVKRSSPQKYNNYISDITNQSPSKAVNIRKDDNFKKINNFKVITQVPHYTLGTKNIQTFKDLICIKQQNTQENKISNRAYSNYDSIRQSNSLNKNQYYPDQDSVKYLLCRVNKGDYDKKQAQLIQWLQSIIQLKQNQHSHRNQSSNSHVIFPKLEIKKQNTTFKKPNVINESQNEAQVPQKKQLQQQKYSYNCLQFMQNNQTLRYLPISLSKLYTKHHNRSLLQLKSLTSIALSKKNNSQLHCLTLFYQFLIQIIHPIIQALRNISIKHSQTFNRVSTQNQKINQSNKHSKRHDNFSFTKTNSHPFSPEQQLNMKQGQLNSLKQNHQFQGQQTYFLKNQSKFTILDLVQLLLKNILVPQNVFIIQNLHQFLLFVLPNRSQTNKSSKIVQDFKYSFLQNAKNKDPHGLTIWAQKQILSKTSIIFWKVFFGPYQIAQINQFQIQQKTNKNMNLSRHQEFKYHTSFIKNFMESLIHKKMGFKQAIQILQLKQKRKNFVSQRLKNYQHLQRLNLQKLKYHNRNDINMQAIDIEPKKQDFGPSDDNYFNTIQKYRGNTFNAVMHAAYQRCGINNEKRHRRKSVQRKLIDKRNTIDSLCLSEQNFIPPSFKTRSKQKKNKLFQHRNSRYSSIDGGSHYLSIQGGKSSQIYRTVQQYPHRINAAHYTHQINLNKQKMSNNDKKLQMNKLDDNFSFVKHASNNKFKEREVSRTVQISGFNQNKFNQDIKININKLHKNRKYSHVNQISQINKKVDIYELISKQKKINQNEMKHSKSKDKQLLNRSQQKALSLFNKQVASLKTIQKDNEQQRNCQSNKKSIDLIKMTAWNQKVRNIDTFKSKLKLKQNLTSQTVCNPNQSPNRKQSPNWKQSSNWKKSPNHKQSSKMNKNKSRSNRYNKFQQQHSLGYKKGSRQYNNQSLQFLYDGSFSPPKLHKRSKVNDFINEQTNQSNKRQYQKVDYKNGAQNQSSIQKDAPINEGYSPINEGYCENKRQKNEDKQKINDNQFRKKFKSTINNKNYSTINNKNKTQLKSITLDIRDSDTYTNQNHNHNQNQHQYQYQNQTYQHHQINQNHKNARRKLSFNPTQLNQQNNHINKPQKHNKQLAAELQIIHSQATQNIQVHNEYHVVDQAQQKTKNGQNKRFQRNLQQIFTKQNNLIINKNNQILNKENQILNKGNNQELNKRNNNQELGQDQKQTFPQQNNKINIGQNNQRPTKNMHDDDKKSILEKERQNQKNLLQLMQILSPIKRQPDLNPYINPNINPHVNPNLNPYINPHNKIQTNQNSIPNDSNRNIQYQQQNNDKKVDTNTTTNQKPMKTENTYQQPNSFNQNNPKKNQQNNLEQKTNINQQLNQQTNQLQRQQPKVQQKVQQKVKFTFKAKNIDNPNSQQNKQGLASVNIFGNVQKNQSDDLISLINNLQQPKPIEHKNQINNKKYIQNKNQTNNKNNIDNLSNQKGTVKQNKQLKNVKFSIPLQQSTQNQFAQNQNDKPTLNQKQSQSQTNLKQNNSKNSQNRKTSQDQIKSQINNQSINQNYKKPNPSFRQTSQQSLPQSSNQNKITNNSQKDIEEDSDLQQIKLDTKTPTKSNTNNPKNKQPNTVNQKPPLPKQSKKDNIPNPSQMTQNKKKINSEHQQNHPSSRQHTGQQSIASSSYGPNKNVKKIVQEFIFMINKIGQAVAKTPKVSKKIQPLAQWYVGVYFLYKRFLYQRKRIQKWLKQGIPKLTRYPDNQINLDDWNSYLKSQQRQLLITKVSQENVNIAQSIQKMYKKLMGRKISQNIKMHATISQRSHQQSRIAVDAVIDQFDILVQKGAIKDEQILVHCTQMINACLILAQLDKMLQQVMPINQLTKGKRSLDELENLAQDLYDLYHDQ